MKGVSLLSEVADTLIVGSPESSKEEAVAVQDCREDLIKADVKQAPASCSQVKASPFHLFYGKIYLFIYYCLYLP